MRIVDLSFPIRPHFRWKVELVQRASTLRGDNFTSSNAILGCHAYTHVDAPRHFLPGTRHIAEMPIDQWMGEAAVVDLTTTEVCDFLMGGVFPATDDRFGAVIRSRLPFIGFDR